MRSILRPAKDAFLSSMSMDTFHMRYAVQKRFRALLWSVIRFIFLSGLCYLIMYPIFHMIVLTFRPFSEMHDPTVVWLNKGFTLFNLKVVLERIKVYESMGNTLKIAIPNTLFQMLSCALAGYGFARFDFRFKKLLFAGVIISIVIPPQVLFIPQYFNFRWFDFFGLGQLKALFTGEAFSVNILNTMYTMLIPSALGSGIQSGLCIFIFVQFFRQLPVELEDAAMIDGAGIFKTFWSIMVPNMIVPCITVFLFTFVWYWNDTYFSGYFLKNLYTLQKAVGDAIGGLTGGTGMDSTLILNSPMLFEALNGLKFDTLFLKVFVQAVCFVQILPLLIIYIFCQKYFVESIERSGLVG